MFAYQTYSNDCYENAYISKPGEDYLVTLDLIGRRVKTLYHGPDEKKALKKWEKAKRILDSRCEE